MDISTAGLVLSVFSATEQIASEAERGCAFLTGVVDLTEKHLCAGFDDVDGTERDLVRRYIDVLERLADIHARALGLLTSPLHDRIAALRAML